MKDKKVNQNLKNLILMVVSALVLISATVCWFFLTSANTVEGFEVGVDSPSSHMVFYEAIDENKNGVVDGTESYKEISTTNIITKNMIPGKTYFYMVKIDTMKDNMKFGLFFNGIEESPVEEGIPSLSSQIKVTANIKKANGNVITATDGEKILSTMIEYDETGTIADAMILTGNNFAKGDYEVYYTIKMAEDATILNEDQYVNINDVSAVLFEG